MKLTTEQNNSLWEDNNPRMGLQIISARAGTGKTTLITEYCISIADKWLDLFSPWQGMAMLSYTNVAKDEIKIKLQKSRGNTSLISYPHSIETIDSFLNKKVFLLHGGTYMGFPEGRPKLVGEPFSTFKSKNNTAIRTIIKPDGKKFSIILNLDYGYIFDKTYYGVDGRIYPNFGSIKVGENGSMKLIFQKDETTVTIPWFNKGGDESKQVKELRAYKEKKHREGLASQGDANYFAYKALISSEYLTKSIIKRFPIFIVDEAQDMTEVQHAIIDHLIDNGLKNIVMIGDEQQAIYEWNTARPELFTEKVKNNKWLEHEINGTFRNSNHICSALNSLTITGEIKPAEKSKNLNYLDEVEIIEWDINSDDAGTEFKSIVDEFAEELSSKDPHNEDEIRLAVLARSKNDATRYRSFCTESTELKVVPIDFEHSHSREMLKVAYSVIIGDTYTAFKSYEKMLYKLSSSQSMDEMKNEILERLSPEESHKYSYRKIIYDDIIKIKLNLKDNEPTISQISHIDKWQLKAPPDSAIVNIKNDFTIESANDQPIANILISQNEKPVDYHSKHRKVRLFFSTIHGVKGETYDGVIYAFREKTQACGCPKQSTNLNYKITSHNMSECESKRIQYVAMSRAAQSLWVVVAKDGQKWQTLLNAVERKIGTKPSKTSKDRVLSIDEWGSIVEGIRPVNRTLSSILRMSSAKVNDDELIISFKYKFHANRFGGIENKQQIKTIAENILEMPIKVSIIHSPRN